MARRGRLSAEEMLGRMRVAIRAHGRSQAATRAATLALVRAAWNRVQDPFDPAAEREFTGDAGEAVAAGRRRVADLGYTDLRLVLDEFGVPIGRAKPVPAAQPRGIPLTEEMARPLAQVRFRVGQGQDVVDAMGAGLVRAQVMADMDLSLAMRDGFADMAEQVPEIVGYRRAIHPELSTGGTCGLCIAAATRLYFKADLMPLHNRCHCLPFPVLEGEEDFVQQINGQDLEDLYRQIGLTRREELSRVRVRVVDHGEIGPVLVQAGHRFRDQGEADDDRRDAGAVPTQRAGGGGQGGAGPPEGGGAGTGDPDDPLLPGSTFDVDLPGRPTSGAPRTNPEPVSATELRAEDGRVAPDVDPDEHFTDQERVVAEWLRALGYLVWSVAASGREREHSPDAVLRAPDGREVTVDFKTLRSAGFSAVERGVRRARNQSERVVLDGRQVELTREAVAEFLGRSGIGVIAKYGASVAEILIIGQDEQGEFRLRWP